MDNSQGEERTEPLAIWVASLVGQYPCTLAAPMGVTWETHLSLQTLPSGLGCCHLPERDFCLGAIGARFIAVNILVPGEPQKHGATPLLPLPSSFLEQAQHLQCIQSCSLSSLAPSVLTRALFLFMPLKPGPWGQGTSESGSSITPS